MVDSLKVHVYVNILFVPWIQWVNQVILLGGIHDVNTIDIWGGMGQSDGVYGESIAKNQGSVQIQLIGKTYGCFRK